MKTLELKLKKDVLIVEIDNKCDITINKDGIYFYFLNGWVKCFKGNYNILCKGSELSEEIASELVNETLMYEKHKVKCYRYRSYKEGFVRFDNAIESFISAVESKKFHWLENPIEIIERGEDTEHNRVLNQNEWQEAEEKTFRNPLIFVKK